jgi:hypothetical protein
MLLRRVLVALGFEHFERLNQLLARFSGLDDGVHVSALGGYVGVGEAVGELFDFLLTRFGAIFGAV